MRNILDLMRGVGETYQRSDGIKADSLKRASDMTKAHAMHKPYTNDFAKNLEEIRRRKLDDTDRDFGICQ